MSPEQQLNFNSIYHQLRTGDQVQSEDVWEDKFDSLADRIILDFHPSSVLDAGCARGQLVKALRKRGVEAWGIDFSETALKSVPPDCQLYCTLGSITQPFPHPHYDVIICIDVIEHLPQDESIKAVENLCQHSDAILLSCMPMDMDNIVHRNARPPQHWAALFSQHGYIHDLDVDLSFVSPFAMLLCKTQLSQGEVLFAYEQKLWQLSQENVLRRNQGVEQLVQQMYEVSVLEGQVQGLKFSLDGILNSDSWRFMTHMQGIRLKLIPLDSRREKAMRLVLRGITALRREGPLGFLALTFQKIKGQAESGIIKFSQRLKLRGSHWIGTGQICEIESISPPLPVKPHSASVDIVICVHNALEDVQRCLESLLEHTAQPYKLILVDDGSNETTAQYLYYFANSHQATLLRSEEATGYPFAANRGMRASSAEFIALVNSDTILTPEWLDRFIACIEADPKIGIAGPLSNTASWQSVPKIEQDGDWASNPLPPGISPARMAQLIATNSARLYVEMPLLNGFCLLLRRKLLDEVGFFDEDNFGQGYGEEDDLILRARSKGWKMALADDVYIFHAQSKSYSSEKRHALSERAGKILREKHGERIISQGISFCRQDPVLEGIRARAQVAFSRDDCINDGQQYSGRKLLFVLPVNSPGGGANVIRSESAAMQLMGARVDYFNLETYRKRYEHAYPGLLGKTIFGKSEDLEFIAQDYDAVIATYNPTVNWLLPLCSLQRKPILGYYIQGFEPLMYVKGSQAYKTALDSYTLIEDMVLFTKTEWTQQQVKEATGRRSEIIGASVDIDLYRPRPRISSKWPEGPLKISAMIRPESPYREPLNTMRLLRQVSQKYKGEVEISLFGTSFENSSFQALPHDFAFNIYGVLRPEQVANLHSQTDIFLDYSTHQAMGLTAMEAMGCGCAVIVPHHGGARSYAIHEQNSLVIDTSLYDNVWLAVQRLIDDEKLRTRLQRNAIHDICAAFPERAALNILNAIFSS